MKIKKISHIAIASSDSQAAKTLYEDILGLTYSGSEEVDMEGVNTHFYQVGESSLEILEALGPDTPVGKFLDRKGPGIHHLALEVEDLDGYVIKLKQAGIQLLSEVPKQGAHDMRIIFIHPKSAGGVLIELSERNSG